MNTLLGVLIGAFVGAVIGRKGRCKSGACPLISNPYFGGLYGALLGAMLAGLLSCSPGGGVPKSLEGSSKKVVTQERLTNVIQLQSEGEFDQVVLQSPVPVVVDCWAAWCSPCRAQAPILEQLANRQGDHMRIVKVNVDELEGLTRRFDIRGIPTLIIFRDGKERTRLIGLHSLDQVKDALGA